VISKSIEIRPQPGPQEQFLASPADIVIYGGGAGGGKTYGLLLEPLRHVAKAKFGGVIFRRTTPQIRNEGGLWDESEEVYPLLGATPKQHSLEWLFPSGCKLQFSHMEYDKTVYDHQGAQYAYIGFDELTHFSAKQFFYLLSRNRSTCGVRPYVRATCNPSPDSWVADFISWWIDKETGYAIKKRSGSIRWFIRLNGKIIWSDTKEELIAEYGKDELPKSVTFIPASVYDNKILMDKDPGYLANLRALSLVDRCRLLECNWKIKEAAGNVFKREWFDIVDKLPDNIIASGRYWDFAATEESKKNPDPCWTAGCKISKLKDCRYIIEHMAHFRERPLATEKKAKQIAIEDGRSTDIYMEQEPGASGVQVVDYYMREVFAGFSFKGLPSTGSKTERAKPLSSQAEGRNVLLLRGPWNQSFLDEAENFPEGKQKDQVDAASGAFNAIMVQVVSGNLTVEKDHSDGLMFGGIMNEVF
jgi:predicted phage terminase large subunit-like protein